MPTNTQFARYLSCALERPVNVVSAEPSGAGFHSRGFKVTLDTGESFFVKQVTARGIGFEIPERKLSSLLVSDAMARRAGLSPLPKGVVASNGEATVRVPDLGEATEIFHVQEHAGDGESYWERLQSRTGKARMDAVDEEEIAAVATYLAKLHKVKHPSTDADYLSGLYNAGLRNALSHPELAMTLMHEFADDHPFLPPGKQGEFIAALWNLVQQWKGRPDRLTALHGDFWGANFFFRSDGSTWVIDYSRVPWGEPGSDVAHWLSQYLHLYHETRNPYFKELGEAFLDAYVAHTGDEEVRERLGLELGLMAVIYQSFGAEKADTQAEAGFLASVMETIHTGTLVWETAKTPASTS